MAKFISLFAGVGGFDLGMEQAGHECVAQVEWDKNAAGVLKHRWPNVPLFCDVSKVTADDLRAEIDQLPHPWVRKFIHYRSLPQDLPLRCI